MLSRGTQYEYMSQTRSRKQFTIPIIVQKCLMGGNGHGICSSTDFQISSSRAHDTSPPHPSLFSSFSLSLFLLFSCLALSCGNSDMQHPKIACLFLPAVLISHLPSVSHILECPITSDRLFGRTANPTINSWLPHSPLPRQPSHPPTLHRLSKTEKRMRASPWHRLPCQLMRALKWNRDDRKKGLNANMGGDTN